MVQYKKDEIKQQIDMAALFMFSDKGYLCTKMSDIADKANISVGNIYRYYANKDELFYAVVPQDFVDRFKEMLFKKLTIAKGKGIEGHKADALYIDTTEQFIQYLVSNRLQFIILIEHGKGTRYKNFKAEFIDYWIDIVVKNYVCVEGEQLPDRQGMISILRVLFYNLMTAYSQVMKQNVSADRIANDLRCINKYHLAGLVELLGH